MEGGYGGKTLIKFLELWHLLIRILFFLLQHNRWKKQENVFEKWSGPEVLLTEL